MKKGSNYAYSSGAKKMAYTHAIARPGTSSFETWKNLLTFEDFGTGAGRERSSEQMLARSPVESERQEGESLVAVEALLRPWLSLLQQGELGDPTCAEVASAAVPSAAICCAKHCFRRNLFSSTPGFRLR
jgi:hypothetical protein